MLRRLWLTKEELSQKINEFEQAFISAIQSIDNGIPYFINTTIGSATFRKGSIAI
ncbi:MAG TPA: hypothetical protein VI548_05890 [Chitinophagaceae bacterium]|nr:hypothetical protein [Chitinophagaceae bacterium]